MLSFEGKDIHDRLHTKFDTLPQLVLYTKLCAEQFDRRHDGNLSCPVSIVNGFM